MRPVLPGPEDEALQKMYELSKAAYDRMMDRAKRHQVGQEGKAMTPIEAEQHWRAIYPAEDRKRWFILSDKMLLGILPAPLTMVQTERLGKRIEEAVAAEREACAKAAEYWAEHHADYAAQMACRRIVAAIRARGMVGLNPGGETRIQDRPTSLLRKPVEWVDSLPADAEDFQYLPLTSGPADLRDSASKPDDPGPVERMMADDGKAVEIQWARSGGPREANWGWAEVKYRIGGGEWKTASQKISVVDPSVPLYRDVRADFSSQFPASKPDDVDYPADHFGDLGGRG